MSDLADSEDLGSDAVYYDPNTNIVGPPSSAPGNTQSVPKPTLKASPITVFTIVATTLTVAALLFGALMVIQFGRVQGESLDWVVVGMLGATTLAVGTPWLWSFRRWRERIRVWHGGKVVIVCLLSGGAALSLFLILAYNSPEDRLGMALFSLAFAGLVISILTPFSVSWTWFTGQEKTRSD